MGHLIPAGTGVSKFRKIRAFPTGEAQLESDGGAQEPESLLSQVDEPSSRLSLSRVAGLHNSLFQGR